MPFLPDRSGLQDGRVLLLLPPSDEGTINLEAKENKATKCQKGATGTRPEDRHRGATAKGSVFEHPTVCTEQCLCANAL